MSLRQRRTNNGDVNPPDVVPASSYDDFDDDNNNGKDKDVAVRSAMPSPLPSPPIEQPITSTNTVDSLLSEYCTFFSQTNTTEQAMKSLQYTLWFFSHITSSHSNSALSPALWKICDEVGNARYVLRFYGIPQCIAGIRSGSWAGNGWSDGRIRKLGIFMAWMMLFYYPLEHASYAGWMVPDLVTVDANRMFSLSCRFWMAFVVGDFLASALKWKELQNWWDYAAAEKNQESNLEERRSIENEIQQNNLQMLRSILLFFPAVHWSLSNWETDPWLSFSTVNYLMLAESYVCIHQTLSNTEL